MEKPPAEHEKLLQHIDQLIAQAPDEAARRELQQMRERLNAPELIAMARQARETPRRQGTRDGKLALEFHDPLLPPALTATGCVVATAVCLFAIVEGFGQPMGRIAGAPVNLWVVAVIAGALSAVFTALSFLRTFSVHVDTNGMASKLSGARWRKLRVGAMLWPDIRSLRERQDRVLEVHLAGGDVLEIPMRVINYPILREHLENMVRLYGDRPGARDAS
jgi:hypothetical protein